MHQSKLIEVLRSLSAQELNRFKEYAASPFFNKQKRCRQLLELLLPHAPEFQSDKVAKTKIFADLFPDQNYHRQRIREEMAALYRLLKGFLAYLDWVDTDFAQEVHLLGQLQKRGLEQVFIKEMNATQKKLETPGYCESSYYFTRYELANLANLYYGQKQTRKFDSGLQDKTDTLDAWYLYIKLMESCEMLNRNRVLSAGYKLNLIDEITDYLKKPNHSFWEIAPIRIYYQILLLYQNESETHFFRLVDLLDELHTQLHPGEARNAYKHAQNYCIRQINQGRVDYHDHLFGIYKRLLESNLILSEGEISHTDYKNIATVAIRLKRFQWAEAFIHGYKGRVSEPHRENVFHFSLASYYEETNQLTQAIRLLQSVSFTDTFYQVSARVLLLKIYYEADELDAAFYQIESFKLFLKRNRELAAPSRASYLNFLRLYKRLAQLKERQGFIAESEYLARMQKIYAQLAGTQPLSNRTWLEEKITV